MSDRKPVIISEEQLEEQRQYIQQIRLMPDAPKSYHVVTYGCQMNAHDSEILAGMLRDMGMEEAADRESADFVLFNTCCVRDNAERRALGNVTWLKEVRKKNPRLMIGVCGCMIQQPGMAEKILKQYRFVDLAFGTANLYRLPELMLKALESDHAVVEVEEQNTIAEGLPVQRLRHDAAYITIMYGCDNYCTYCIVPYVRGRERSREMSAIVAEAEALRDSGVKEIMLLGQNVNSYGKGLQTPVTFAQLLKALDDVGIPRIRFMTSHPKDLSDELIDVMAHSKHILPQFHLPVQHGNDEILRRMNRHYNRAQYLDRVRKLREAIPAIGLTTDIIVGFPGETEEQFQDTLSLVREVGYDSAFTFIYSPRTGTGAAKMPNQVPEDVSSRRIQELLKVQEECQKKALKRFIGTEEEVLVEGLSRRSDTDVSGHGLHGLSVTFPGTESDVGEIVRVKIVGAKNNTLTGEKTLTRLQSERTINMKEVMMCAQKLAEAILNSDVYQHMHTLEEQVTQDEDATKAIAAYMEKRTAVEQAMRKPDIDPSQLAEAAQELEDVQQAMNDCPIIRDMRDAQKKYQDMMDNVNRILRLVVTGETEDDKGGQPTSGCTGNCASCGGCH